MPPSAKDPRSYAAMMALGARCDICPLGLGIGGLSKKPVPSEIRPGTPLVVAESPGAAEDDEGRPLVGPSGAEFTRTLKEAGLSRYDVSLGNVICCRPGSQNNLDIYLRKLAKTNRARKKEKLEAIPSPIDCCAPRLRNEIKSAPAVLALGKTALSSIAGPGLNGEDKMASMRGFPFWLNVDDEGKSLIIFDRDLTRSLAFAYGHRPFLATYHPAFVLRRRRWTYIVRGDVRKFFRHINGEMNWTPPTTVFPKTLQEIARELNFFAKCGEPVASDLETGHSRKGGDDATEPTKAKLRCLGIGTATRVIVIPFLSIDYETRFWSADKEARIKAAISKFYTLSGIRHVGQNFIYDSTVMDGNGIIPPLAWSDLAVGHHVGRTSELPHSLDFQISVHLDSAKHKGDSRPEAWPNDETLHVYCGDDVATTAALAPHIGNQIRESKQERVFLHDMRKSYMCRAMHKIGIASDSDEVARLDKLLYRRMQRASKRACEAVGKDPATFNIGSSDQVRALLFDEFGLEVATIDEGRGKKKPVETPTGDPSTSRQALEALLDRGVEPRVETFIYEKLNFGESAKFRGTFALGAKPHADGRVRSTFLAHTVPSGRLSSSRPSLQNVPADMRSRYVAAPGHVFITSDKSNLEARVMAAISNDEMTLTCFKNGIDQYKKDYAEVFSVDIEKVSAEERQLAKVFRLACQYGAGYLQVWKQIRGFWDGDDKRPYAGIELKKVQALHGAWWQKHAPLKTFQHDMLAFFKKHGYVETPILKRRRYFLDATSVEADDHAMEEVKEAMFNHPIQGGAADSVDLSTFEVIERVPWDFGNNIGLVHQGHDALTLEVREEDVDWAARIMKTHMTTTFMGLELPCDLKVGKRMIAAKSAEKLAKRASKEALLAAEADDRALVEILEEEASDWKRIAAEGLKDYELKL